MVRGPRVSVVIATRNRADKLGRAIESAASAAEDLEILVVDDASTDATPDVARSCRNVRCIQLPKHSGVSAARNAGILAATGTYVSYLDDDDLRLPGSLDQQCTLLDEMSDHAFAYGAVVLVDQQYRRIGTSPDTFPTGDIFWDLVSYNFIPGVSVVLRRTAITRVGLFDPQLPTAEDWDLWLRLAESHPVAATEDPMVIVRSPEPGAAQASLLTPDTVKRSLRVQERALARAHARRTALHRAPLAKQQLRRRYAAALLDAAAQRVRHGSLAEAGRFLVHAALLDAAAVARPYTLRVLLAAAIQRSRDISGLVRNRGGRPQRRSR